MAALCPSTAPAAASPSTCTNSRRTSARCRRRNSATARWLGLAPPQITRQPRSSTHASRILREDRIPLNKQYSTSGSIIAGSYGACPCPSAR